MMTIRLIADFDNTLDDALNGVTEAGAALGRMYRAALARAEAAEAERNELRERHDNLKNAYANLVKEAAGRLVRRLVRMYAAERRVAELEAQLAAQGWRPVTITEPPPDAAEQEAVNKAERRVAALRRRIDEAERQTERE